MPTAPRDDRGFTLVELMVVIALMGTLMAIAVGAWTGYARAREASGSSTELREVLRQAQQRAVTEGTSVCVDFRSGSYQVYRGACDSATRTAVGPAAELPGGVTVRRSAFTYGPGTVRTGVTFRSRGTATPGTVVIGRDDASARTVSVEGLTGRVAID